MPSPARRVVEFGRTSSFKLAVCSASSSNAEVSAERRLRVALEGFRHSHDPPSRTTCGMMWFGFSVPAVGAGAEGDATVRLGG